MQVKYGPSCSVRGLGQRCHVVIERESRQVGVLGPAPAGRGSIFVPFARLLLAGRYQVIVDSEARFLAEVDGFVHASGKLRWEKVG